MILNDRKLEIFNVADKLPRYKGAAASVASELACLCVFARRQVSDVLRLVLVVISLMILVGSVAASASSLTILYTNDIHNRLGSLAGLGELIEQERGSSSSVLLFDSGDTWQDFRVPLYAVWGSNEMVSWMNDVGYDAMAIGNHDIYYGVDRLGELSSKAKFPLLSANMVPLAGYRAPYARYTIDPIGGMRVLVIGVITAEYLSYPDYPWLRYVPPAQAIQGVLDEMRGQYDFVIVLGHLPVAQAVQIARVVPDIDVFLSGHSHELTPQPVKQGDTLILQAGAFGHYLGRLKLEIDPQSGEITSASNALLETNKNPVALDRGYVKLFTMAILLATSLFLLIR
ncbi:metallophosphatase [Candidatus Bipolaricaulota bacterium]|nr:metallophosphatase [Candidatus Bipolaricaulota bacterium]